jgi:leader peptidase (prepilin peptidase)/N-methyltransferase
MTYSGAPLLLCALLLGAILGSFLNALLFRFNTGKGMGGRSRCMRCNHTLAALDLVPILSFVLLGGRCRYCASRISAQYPLVEFAAALLSGALFVTFGDDLLLYAFWLVVWLTVLFIFVYDLRHMIIPWSASLFLLFCAFVSLAFSPAPMANLLAGICLALPLFLLSLISAGRWMGWADSLFELSLGMFLGFSVGLSGLLLGIWTGALVGVAIVLWARLTPKRRSRGTKRGFTIQSEIPFAPFLALGAAVAFFLHVDFFSTLLLF